MTGTNAEGAIKALERWQPALAQAQTGTGKVAEGLQALGLSAQQLIGMPLPEQLNILADAVSKFADSTDQDRGAASARAQFRRAVCRCSIRAARASSRLQRRRKRPASPSTSSRPRSWSRPSTRWSTSGSRSKASASRRSCR